MAVVMIEEYQSGELVRTRWEDDETGEVFDHDPSAS